MSEMLLEEIYTSMTSTNHSPPKSSFIGGVVNLFWEKGLIYIKKIRQQDGFEVFINPELGLKSDGISVRKLWKSNLEVGNKITEKGALVSN